MTLKSESRYQDNNKDLACKFKEAEFIPFLVLLNILDQVGRYLLPVLLITLLVMERTHSHLVCILWDQQTNMKLPYFMLET
jgi:hypothetical protein